MKKQVIEKITALCLVLPLCLVFMSACKKKTVQPEPVTVLLSQSEISIEAGQSYTLEANVRDAVWSTDNAAIARVDVRGRVTGVSAGTAVIVAEKDGSRASCTVTVTQKQEQEQIYSVRAAARELTVKAGGTANINASLFVNGEPSNEKMTYSSSDEAVARVDENGVVTAVTAGSAMVSASYGKAKAVVSVTVTAEDAAFSLSSRAIEVQLGTTVTLTTTSTGSVEWRASDGKISVDDSGAVTGLALGESVVTARFGGEEKICRVTVYDAVAVKTVEDFVAMKNNKYIRYELTADIDFSGYEWTQSNIVSEFSSRLDGNGKKLYGLQYDKGGRWIGVFGTLTQSAVIENLALYVGKFSYESDCGILALNNFGAIKNCYFYTKQENSNNDVNVKFRSGIVRDNYGTISGVIVEPHSLSGGSVNARIHALAGLNAGSISSVIVVSAAKPVFSSSDTYWLMHQLISGSAGGYADNYKPENSADFRRTESVIFATKDDLFDRKGIRGDASLVQIAGDTDDDIEAGIETGNLQVTGDDVIAKFDKAVWSFDYTGKSVTLCGTKIY